MLSAPARASAALLLTLRLKHYLRTLRGALPTLYGPDEQFPVGGSRVLRSHGDHDDVTLAGCGITVHEALKAADELEREGIAARVLDLYSVKPIDTLTDAAGETGGLVFAEDHWPEGGLAEAALSALADAGTQHRCGRSAFVSCRRPGDPTSCCTRPGSTRPRSRPPRAPSSAPDRTHRPPDECGARDDASTARDRRDAHTSRFLRRPRG